MKYRIRKRHVLLIAIATAQAVCLCWGVFLFNTWLRASVQGIVQEQVMADNVQTANQMMTLIDQMEVSDLRENPDSWLKLQNAVREIKLPNEGFACVIDSKNGELLCHPALREAPATLRSNLALKQSSMTKPSLAKPDMAKPDPVKPIVEQPTMQKSPVDKSTSPRSSPSGTDETTVRGYLADHGGELQIIAAGYVPNLDVYVNVHQKAAGIEKKIAHIMRPVVPLGLTIACGLVALTTALVLLILRQYDNRLAVLNENLEDMVDQRTASLRKTRDAVIFGLAKLAESRDTDTGEHLERIRIYVTTLAERLSQKLKWVDSKYIQNLALASSLHDIGKVAIPDSILLKPGRFEPDERAVMETHAEKGGLCLEAISQHLGEDDFLQLSREIAYSHHEKWDGTGYPYQLAEDKIPFAARIVALADVYDALRSRRPYKEPMPHENAKRIILAGRGSHFDPLIVDAFLACEDEFISISAKYQMNPESVHDTNVLAEELVMS